MSEVELEFFDIRVKMVAEKPIEELNKHALGHLSALIQERCKFAEVMQNFEHEDETISDLPKDNTAPEAPTSDNKKAEVRLYQ